MSLDLEFGDDAAAIGEAVRQFCEAEFDDASQRAGGFSRALWGRLAELGVLEAGRPSDDAGALEVCAVMEALGDAAFPGPLAASYLARRVLDDPERTAVAQGEALVCFGSGELAPFAGEADVFIQLDAAGLHRATPGGRVQPVMTLAGEPWGRVRFERGPALADDGSAVALHELARAAYLAALGGRLVREASEHARVRKQFGRAIGEFQGVAHPLADAFMRVCAAQALARAAAWQLADFDARRPAEAGDASTEACDGPCRAAALAVSSARGAALEAAHTAHQVFGAIGITLEGPVFHLSRCVRQRASDAPTQDHARARILAGLALDAPAA